MTEKNNIQDEVTIKVPKGCPQCPEGGYELISGVRRALLLQEMNQAFLQFQEQGDFHDLLSVLQQLVIKGIEIQDIDRAVINTDEGDVFIGCRKTEEKNDPAGIEICVVDNDKKYTVTVEQSAISPMQVTDIPSCPLIGTEDRPGCVQEKCEIIQQAKLKLKNE